MNIKPLLAVLLVLLGSSTAFAQDGGSDACLVLQPTRMLADDIGEAGADLGDGWLGLAPDGNHWTLAPARIRFEPAQPDGTVVEITPDVKKAVALLHCKMLRQGGVDAANLTFSNGGRTVEPGVEPLRFAFHDRRYALRYTTSGVVIVEGDGKRSALHDFGGSTPPFRATLIWAGDLDRDGRPDFLMEFGSEIGTNFCLFTSGNAKENEMVRPGNCMDVSG
ncbi:hypothetical protein CH72_4199 [Burkholderia ambifaria AMMD]|uniref:Uncharacterized protein n=1 Tax=Burkholderia ambifaria (strain ATCC BAA-244 / DSM 16087 / CCUG 44356 / LMG 19182 / AMMD) TaxID=339670 RepID=Q0B805_BURCM|nr:hypothetical protein [Burkholderia ambifaria]ABI89718.1 conserved hypothetical protein [Burkholderia ambifaria AMMD]AJY25652.1 hypothetical protein CH72_4199 [Burkholderia ambifaria AMMD]MBR7930259.1 hypothetical protein [Burkholderia ambifaria]PEH67830.1 hypothetical protein CRM91_07440 [Burkholderia ambifaria]QQC07629.1 hypothetical protein I6H84_19355 [Burkholderia ambifaria]